MTTITNNENLRQYKNIFSLIVEQILGCASSTNLFREVKNKFPNFNQIAWPCLELLNFLIWIGRSNLRLNFKKFPKTLYLYGLCKVDMNYYFLQLNQALPIFPGVRLNYVTIHHHPPPPATSLHQPKYIHHHPPTPTDSKNISTTINRNPKYILVRRCFIRKTLRYLFKSKWRTFD